MIMTMDNWFCNKSTNFTSKRQNDICSSYIFSDAFMCKVKYKLLIIYEIYSILFYLNQLNLKFISHTYTAIGRQISIKL